MAADPRIAVVAAGYDAIAANFAAWATRQPHDARSAYLDLLDQRVPMGGRLLDIGCGQGIPRLYQRYDVTALDVSEAQVARARRRWPQAVFHHADLLEADLPQGDFGAAVAIYSLIHVPRELHPQAWQRLASWLRPGGIFAGCVGAVGGEGEDADWLGTRMYWSNPDPNESLSFAAAAGLDVLQSEVITELEDGEPVSFLWLLAQRLPE
jgi:SAM-dependent methyltransferase